MRKGKLRERQDGFTPERQKKALVWLARTGCVKDACGKVGISTTTYYRTCERLPDFAEKARKARLMAATELEAVAYTRAIEGAEETVIRDGKVAYIRKKPSDAILRTLLEGSNPGKYRRGGESAAKQTEEIEKRLREKIEAEVRAEVAAERAAEAAAAKANSVGLIERLAARIDEAHLAACEFTVCQECDRSRRRIEARKAAAREASGG